MFDTQQFKQLVSEAVGDTMRAVFRHEFAHLFNTESSAQEEYLTIDETCERLSISKTTLWQLRRRGEITGHQVGRRVLLRASDVEALVEGTN